MEPDVAVNVPKPPPDEASAGRSPAPSAADGSTAAGESSARARRAAAVAWWVLGLSAAAVICSGLQIWTKQPGNAPFLLTLCFLVCGVAAWLDVATRRIPNVLTYPAILIGLGLNLVLGPALQAAEFEVPLLWLGAVDWRDGALGFLLCASIGVISFIMRGLGGGDVKLLAALGAMLGLHAVVAVLFNTLVFAAVIGIANWAVRGTLVPRLQVIAGNLLVWMVTRSELKKVYPFQPSESPFGLSLLLGLILAQFIAVHRELLNVTW